MKKLGKLILAFTLFAVVCTLVSCSSKEEKVISELEKIVEKVEKTDKMDMTEVLEIEKEFSELNEQAQDCDFNESQKIQIMGLMHRFSLAINNQHAGFNEDMGLPSVDMDDVKNAVDNVMDLFK